ncbi:hypothetical protein JTB14_010016 [Gonioctena quinquepunctata]|nr:hypothetical protein JTB14_010016 [Gonioctena quinquepunctata]
MNGKRLYIGFTSVNTKDYIVVPRCLKCQYLGHTPDGAIDHNKYRSSTVVRKKKETVRKTEPNINEIYANIEVNMKLSRLEEPKILITALRHYVRNKHIKGNKVTFPVPGAVDQIQLKCYNIPTHIDELEGLLKQVFSRWNEVLDLEELYRDFAITHGRIAFDHTKSWPLCHIHIRSP